MFLLCDGSKRLKTERKVLFLCVHNSARSQMAEGFLRHLYGDRYEAYSAGITPTQVNPYAIKAMAEVGIDISGQRSKSFREFSDLDFDVVISTCDEAEKACPFFPAKKILKTSISLQTVSSTPLPEHLTRLSSTL